MIFLTLQRRYMTIKNTQRRHLAQYLCYALLNESRHHPRTTPMQFLISTIACAVYLIIYSARFLDEFCISVFIFLQLIACINYLFIAIAYIYFSYDFYNIATSGYNTLNDILICLDVSVLFGVLFGTDRINDTSS